MTRLAKGASFRHFVEREMGKFPHFILYAFLESILIMILFLDGFIAFVAARFAKFFDLDTPCLLCTRLDCSGTGCYDELLCEFHKRDMSSLAYCPVHRRLSDIRRMCDGCLGGGGIVIMKGNVCSCCGEPNKVKGPVTRMAQASPRAGFASAKAEEARSCLYLPSIRMLKVSSNASPPDRDGKKDLKSAAMPICPESKDRPREELPRTSSFSKENRISSIPNLNSIANSPRWNIRTPRKSMLDRMELATDLVDQTPGTEPDPNSIMNCLKRSIMLDSGPNSPRRASSTPKKSILDKIELGSHQADTFSGFELDPESIMNRLKRSIRLDSGPNSPIWASRTPRKSMLDRVELGSDRTNLAPGIEPDPESIMNRLKRQVRLDSRPNSPRWANRSPRKSILDKMGLASDPVDSIIGTETNPDSILARLKTQVRLDRKTLITLYMELDEERSASTVAAKNAMAMITRLQAEKAAIEMEALQYQRMMEEQAQYDQEALQAVNALLTKREEELELYREKYGLISEFANGSDGDLLEVNSFSSFTERSDHGSPSYGLFGADMGMDYEHEECDTRGVDDSSIDFDNGKEMVSQGDDAGGRNPGTVDETSQLCEKMKALETDSRFIKHAEKGRSEESDLSAETAKNL